MKRLAQLSLAFTALAALAAPPEGLPVSKQIPVFTVPAPTVPKEPFIYTDKPALILAPLVNSSAVRAVAERFQTTYAKLGLPRLLIRVNPAARTLANRSAPERGGVTEVEENLAASRELTALLTKAFQQTGARVMERETSAEPAEIVIEVLAAQRRIIVRELSGDREHLVPELQLAAVRLADGRLLAQANARELFGTDVEAARLLRHFKLAELAEAVALRLMEELAAAKQP